MKIVINDRRTQERELVYTENLWTGRRTVTYNGIEAEKKSRKEFVLHLENGSIPFEVQGNVFKGITLASPLLLEPVQMRKGFNALEYVLSILAAVLSIVCGFLGGLAGGVIGGVLQGICYGLIGGIGFTLVAIAVICIEKKWLRYVVCAELVLVCAALAFFLGYGFALLRLAFA